MCSVIVLIKLLRMYVWVKYGMSDTTLEISQRYSPGYAQGSNTANKVHDT